MDEEWYFARSAFILAVSLLLVSENWVAMTTRQRLIMKKDPIWKIERRYWKRPNGLSPFRLQYDISTEEGILLWTDSKVTFLSFKNAEDKVLDTSVKENCPVKQSQASDGIGQEPFGIFFSTCLTLDNFSVLFNFLNDRWTSFSVQTAWAENCYRQIGRESFIRRQKIAITNKQWRWS